MVSVYTDINQRLGTPMQLQIVGYNQLRGLRYPVPIGYSDDRAISSSRETGGRMRSLIAMSTSAARTR